MFDGARQKLEESTADDMGNVWEEAALSLYLRHRGDKAATAVVSLPLAWENATQGTRGRTISRGFSYFRRCACRTLPDTIGRESFLQER